MASKTGTVVSRARLMLDCRNQRCRESAYDWTQGQSHAFGFCPSCWLMVKVGTGIGMALVTGAAALIGAWTQGWGGL